MKLIYVTVSLPYGPSEAFLLPEIQALLDLGHEILIVPRSPGGMIVHDEGLLGNSRLETLLSLNVLSAAVRAFFTRPIQVARAILCIKESRSPVVWLKNMIVVPKAIWLSEIARNFEADHIHCHWAATTATMTMIASRLAEISWSFTAHRGDIVADNLLDPKVRRASFARFISQDGLRLAKSRGVRFEGRVRVLHMGVTIPARARWQPPAEPKVLCPARLEEVKGHRFLLAAWRMLHDRGLKGQLWLAGEGRWRARLEAIVRDLELEDEVRFLGTLPHESLLRLYETNSISAVVLPSVDLGNGYHEGIPVALIEAMSYGVPVVGTHTGAIPELVTAGAGLLVHPGNLEGLANAIQLLLQDRHEAVRIGTEGRRRVVQAYGAAQVAQDLATAFTQAVASSHLPFAPADRRTGVGDVRCPSGSRAELNAREESF